MSQKLLVEMTSIGELDSVSNPVLQNGRGCRALLDIGDLDGDDMLRSQPGVSQVLGAPLIANYTTGTVAVTVGSKSVTGSTTAFLANAFSGDIFVGPDGAYYTIDTVTSDTAFTLRSKYQGATNATGTYTIKHKVWMLTQFYGSSGARQNIVSPPIISTTGGTFANTRSSASGVCLTPKQAMGVTFISGSAETFGRIWPVSGSSGMVTKIGTQFTVPSEITIAGMWFPACFDSNYATNVVPYTISIQTETVGASGGYPSGTLIDVDATKTTTIAAQKAQAGGISWAWHAFAGSVTLSPGANYWFVVESAGEVAVTIAGSKTNYGSLATYKTLVYTPGGVPQAWYRAYQSMYSLLFAFTNYYTSSTTNTYKTSIIDTGSTPTVNGTLTISRAAKVPTMAADFTATMINAESGFPDTLTWELNASANADMSSPTQVATGQTALTYTITGAGNLKRYYQVTFTMNSATGRSTPLVSKVEIFFPTTANSAATNNSFQMVGICKSIYTQIQSGASTISTTQVPDGKETRPVAYQRNLIWVSSAVYPRYWDGIMSAADYLASMLQSDNVTAGDDPPARANGICYHNDKLIMYRDVGIFYHSGGSTTVTDTVLTKSGEDFVIAGTGITGFRLYPDVNNWPLAWWTIVSNTATTATVATGSTMTGVAANGDSYLITRNYQKTCWYCEEEEPADWPSVNYLKFGDDDGDRIQAMISWKGRLVVVCRNQIWRVTGYGPETPWEKELMAARGGTLSPDSVIASEESVYWLATQGYAEYTGGYSGALIASDRFRDQVIDDLNEELRDQVTGVYFQGLCIWSFPTAGSCVNNRTIIYCPATRRWTMRDFGFYTPAIMTNAANEEELFFWEPRSGNICKLDNTTVMYPFGAPTFEATTAFLAADNPANMAQWLTLRVVLKSAAAATINVEYATDYNPDTYTSAGTLVPIDSAVSGRVAVNSTDMTYICRFAATVRGSSISIKLSGQIEGEIKIYQMELTADPVESETYS